MKKLPLCNVSTLGDSRDGRPRFLARTSLGPVVVLFVDSALAYVRTPDASDSDVPDDLREAGLVVNGTAYRYASGHFRKGAEGWAVDLDGFRPRLTVSRGHASGGMLGDATDAGRAKCAQVFADACRVAQECGPEVLARAERASLRGDLERADREISEAVGVLRKATERREVLARDLALSSGEVPPEPLPEVSVEEGRAVLALDGAEVTLALGVSGLRLGVDFDPEGDRTALDALRVGEHCATPADDVSALLFDTPDAGRREARALLRALFDVLGEREGLRLAEGRAPGEVLAVDRKYREAYAVAVRAAGVLGGEVPAEVVANVERIGDVVRAARALYVEADALLAVGLRDEEARTAFGRERARLLEALERFGLGVDLRARRVVRDASRAATVRVGAGVDPIESAEQAGDLREALDALAEALDPFGEAVES